MTLETDHYEHLARKKGRAGRAPGLGFIFVTLVLDILGIGIIVPIVAKLVEEMHGGGMEAAAPVYGAMVALYCLMQFVCAPLLGSLSDQIGRRPVILFALLGMGLDYFLLAWAPTLTWIFIGRVIAGMTGANFSAATAYIADISPPGETCGKLWFGRRGLRAWIYRRATDRGSAWERGQPTFAVHRRGVV